MGMEYEANMDMDGFMSLVLSVFPRAQIDEDNDGQLIIYTNLTQTDEGTVVDMDD